jgi:hypothetical protein
MYLTIEQIIQLGISRSAIKRNIARGNWQSRRSGSKSSRVQYQVLIASLPVDLQTKWFRRCAQMDSAQTAPIDTEKVINEQDEALNASLLRLPSEERGAWIDEASRLASLVERYEKIKKKRRRNPATGKYEYTFCVIELCQEAACQDQTILARAPHRGEPPSPHTLDGLARKYREDGLLAFLRRAPRVSFNKPDRRRAEISDKAIEWINSNWRRFSSSTHLYNKIEEIAKEKHWTIPSQSWFYRLWADIPEIVKTFYLKGESAYISKYAPYVPRDVSDLQVLQILCGDHSERDVTVLLPDNTLARPWLSLWYDLRLGLIWGWHLSLSPSSYTAGLAYADGVTNFGAQPISRPDEGFFSYVYTDHGRDYKSHNWDGKEIAVHKEAMRIDGGLEFLFLSRRVGIIDDFGLKHLLARRGNAREKPVERVFRVISEWEQNTFQEYCGRDAKTRPDNWYKLFVQHERFVRGERSDSPFGTFDQYREDLARFITRYNSSAHERLNLGGKTLVPLEEYQRLYTTRYKISQETLALLLMKAVKRVIYKNGVQCFQKNWFYHHEAMASYKGLSVEVRYTDGDYSKVSVILPNSQICEALLITPSPILNPNKQTVKVVVEARAHERRVISDFNLVAQSRLRGETTEDRVAKTLAHEARAEESELTSPTMQAVVHKLTRMDGKKLQVVASSHHVEASEVSAIEADNSIFSVSHGAHISEFDQED